VHPREHNPFSLSSTELMRIAAEYTFQPEVNHCQRLLDPSKARPFFF